MTTCVLFADGAAEGQSMEIALRRRGHEVTRVKDHAHALAAVKALRPYLVVFDWDLAADLASAFVNELRDSKELPTPYLLAFTRSEGSHAITSILETEVSDLVILPRQEELLDVRLAVAERAVREGEGRTRAEAALWETETTLRNLIDSAPFLMGVVEVREGKVVPLAANVEDEPPPSGPRSAPSSRPHFEEPLVHVEGWITKYRSIERDGKPMQLEIPQGIGSDARWWLVTISPLPFGRSPTLRYSYIVEDITVKKRMHAQLALADRMVSVGTLASGVAHEINNPLTYVIMNLAFLERELSPARVAAAGQDPAWLEAVRTSLDRASDGAQRVRQIVKDLRTFSRGSYDKRGAIDVRLVLESAIKMAWNEVRHHATLVRDYENPPLVEANEARLAQLFLNLIMNAVQAIPEGRAAENQIVVHASRDADGHAIVEIRDTGVGIPLEIIGRVFDPFFTTKSIGEGTGLGLSICHGIVSSLGGEITAVSTVHHGSTFRVRLPASQGAAVSEEGTLPASDKRRARILVLDEDVQITASLERLLGRDHDVRVALSVEAALEHFRSGERFDLALCDLTAPLAPAIELYESLALVAPDQRDRLVFFTGGEASSRARAFLAKVPNPCLEKPFDQADVESLIARVVR